MKPKRSTRYGLPTLRPILFGLLVLPLLVGTTGCASLGFTDDDRYDAHRRMLDHQYARKVQWGEYPSNRSDTFLGDLSMTPGAYPR